MEHERKSFLFYGSYIDAVERIKDKDAKLELLLAIAYYGLDKTEPQFNNDLANMAWVFIAPLLDANHRNYENGCKGGAPSESMKGNQNARKKKQTQNKPKSNPKQTQNKGNDNVNDNDNVNVNYNANDNANDNVNVNDNVNDNIKKFKEICPYVDDHGMITDWDNFQDWKAKHPTWHYEEDE